MRTFCKQGSARVRFSVRYRQPVRLRASSRRTWSPARWGLLLALPAAALAAGVVGSNLGHAASRTVAAPSAIDFRTLQVVNSRFVGRVRILPHTRGVRWKLRIDSRFLPSLRVRTTRFSSPFVAPGDHRTQAILLDKRGKRIAASPVRSVHVDALVAAAGDIACDPAEPGFAGTGPECHQRQTAALLGLRHYSAIFTLGDEQYECGAANAFEGSYDKTWGKYKAITHPAVGDHEYGTTKLGCPKGTAARDYFAYFGAAAGPPSEGYYSFDLAGWHIVVLNANCDEIGGCGTGSPEEQWLAADLAAHPALCTAAYWHEPRFSSALAGDDTQVDAFWRDLYAAHAEVVLNGHAHVYERYAPQTPDAVAAPDGITEFVVGVGGRSFSVFQPQLEPLSVSREADTYGLLALTLRKSSYSYQFVPEQGKTYADAGTVACH
jgi:acid phosphatase type 7